MNDSINNQCRVEQEKICSGSTIAGIHPERRELRGTLQASKLHIVMHTKWVEFPNGMAMTQRIRLIAQSMIENGADVTVLILYPSERLPLIRNSVPKGVYNGINFEYTAGTTIRPEYFIILLLLTIKSIFITTLRLCQLKYQGRLDCIYYWDGLVKISFFEIFIWFLAKLLNVPVIHEVDERPWSLIENNSFFEKRISPIKGINGAITISEYLYEYIHNEAQRLKKTFFVIKIPIVADANEQISLNESLEPIPTVLFAGSLGYTDTIRFILDSMYEVWKQYPNCRLTITGFSDDDLSAIWIKNEITAHKLNNVELAGYLDRQTLLKRYMSAWALLVPLFNDIRSTARFPTKIGEYLLSGRPVITNNVGEIPRYLVDGTSALICEPDDVKAYAEKIIEVIENPSRAALIGSKGKQVAIESFHYAKYGEKLVSFFETVRK